MATGMVGPYAIEAELGRGSKGSVYRATDTRNGQSVALRCVDLMGVDISPALFRQRLRQEAAKAMELDHPHIIPIRDVGEHYTVIYIAMTLTEGVTLGWMFSQGRRFPFAEAQHHAKALIGAMAYAHGKGLQHGDLKPGNLLIDASGCLWVADYGVLRLPAPGLGQQPKGASHLPRYASPEQILNQPTELCSDVFSLGAILYELFCGKPAFGANPAISLFDLMQEILATQPPRPSTINPALPKDLDTLIMSMLERRPENRPRTATEVLPLLEAVLDADGQKAGRTVATTEDPAVNPRPDGSIFDVGSEETSVDKPLPKAGGGAEASFEASLLEDIAKFSHRTDSRLQAALARETPARSSRGAVSPDRARPDRDGQRAQRPTPDPLTEKSGTTHSSALTQSHFLAELAREAERIAPAAREALNLSRPDPDATRAQVDQAMRQVLSYVRELRNQLNIIRPAVPREYNLVGAVILNDLRWADGDVNFENTTQLGGRQALAFVRLHFSLVGPQPLLVKRDGLGVDQLQRHLFDAGLEFDAEETRNDRGQVERAVFKVSPVVRVRIEILPSYSDGQIIIKGRHMDHFGSSEFRIPAQALDSKLLDDFSKLLLARPNRMHSWSRPPQRS